MTITSPRTAAQTSAPAQAPSRQQHRDTGIDLVRALCVLGVVVLHALMVGVTVTDAGPVFANASEGSAWIAPLSWVLQVMPLFFVIGGFAGSTAYRRGGGNAVWFVAARVHRLLLPAVATIAVAGIGLVTLAATGVSADLLLIAGYRFGQPLWFLGVFLLCQALLPVLIGLHVRAPLRTLGVLAGAAVAVDVLRGVSGIEGIGFLNLAFVWLVLQQIGFFLADGALDRLSRRIRRRLALLSVGVLAAAMLSGVWSPDLISHINPPTTALVLVGLAHTMLFSLHRERWAAWSRRPLLAGFHRFVTARAMTIYLWHMPLLLTMAGALALTAVLSGTELPEPGSAAWWLGRPLWLLCALLLTALIAAALAPLESRRAPQGTRSIRRITAAVLSGILGIVLLLVAGTTVLTAGISVALLIAALSLAATPRHTRSMRKAKAAIRSLVGGSRCA